MLRLLLSTLKQRNMPLSLAEEHALFETICQRHTNRQAFEQRAMPEDDQDRAGTVVESDTVIDDLVRPICSGLPTS